MDPFSRTNSFQLQNATKLRPISEKPTVNGDLECWHHFSQYHLSPTTQFSSHQTADELKVAPKCTYKYAYYTQAAGVRMSSPRVTDVRYAGVRPWCGMHGTNGTNGVWQLRADDIFRTNLAASKSIGFQI